MQLEDTSDSKKEDSFICGVVEGMSFKKMCDTASFISPYLSKAFMGGHGLWTSAKICLSNCKNGE
jgi:hypothetical protein